jgi:ribosomal protein S18 acetylase RimI-like enzyme
MKTLRSFILTLLLASASLRAMESNVEIVSFDRQKHHQRVSTLLKETFKDPTIQQQDTVSVLVQKNRATRHAPAETILGCVTYYNSYPSQPSDPKITTIKYLVIAKEHRRQGYGKLLMQHVEDYARNNNSDKIVGTATPSAIKFYEKLGASKDTKNSNFLSMQLSNTDNEPKSKRIKIDNDDDEQ